MHGCKTSVLKKVQEPESQDWQKAVPPWALAPLRPWICERLLTIPYTCITPKLHNPSVFKELLQLLLKHTIVSLKCVFIITSVCV